MKFVLRSGNTGYSLGHGYLRIQTLSPKTLVRCVLAYSAGVFTGRTNVFARESAMLKLRIVVKKGAEMGRVNGYYFYSPQSSSVIKSKISPGHPK